MLWPFCNCAGAKSIRERRQFCGAREIPDLAALAGLSYADGIDSPSRVRDVEQSSPVRYLCRVRGPSTGCGGGEIAYPFACLALQVDKFTSRRLFDRLLQPHDPHHAARRNLDDAAYPQILVADEHGRPGEGFDAVVVVDRAANRQAGLRPAGLEVGVVDPAVLGFARLDSFDRYGAAEAGGGAACAGVVEEAHASPSGCGWFVSWAAAALASAPAARPAFHAAQLSSL